MVDMVITQPVAVVPVVLDADADGLPDMEHAPVLGEKQANELYRNHVQEFVTEIFEARNVAVIAYGDACPRGRSMLCMPGALWHAHAESLLHVFASTPQMESGQNLPL
jgi:hypothetical protein